MQICFPKSPLCESRSAYKCMHFSSPDMLEVWGLVDLWPLTQAAILFHGFYSSDMGSTKFSVVINRVLVIQWQVAKLCQPWGGLACSLVRADMVHTAPPALPALSTLAQRIKKVSWGGTPWPSGAGMAQLCLQHSYFFRKKCLITILFSLSIRNENP